MSGPPRAWFLIGPTGSGKTALSLALAEALGAEIACMDSMQVYRGIPIASAQPSGEDRVRVPHHLFSWVDLEEHFDAARYAQAAGELVTRRPRLLFVGGTGLYFKALVEGLAPLPARDPALRAAIQAELAARGPAALRAELAAADPAGAARLGAGDLRRLERALEILRLTGRPPSELKAAPGRPVVAPVTVLGLRAPRAWLHARLDARLAAMEAAGLEDEMRGLWERYRDRPGPTALQAIGYAAFAAWFEGRVERHQARATVLAQTTRLVRHQETWFRKVPGVDWLDAQAPDLAARAVALVAGAGPAATP